MADTEYDDPKPTPQRSKQFTEAALLLALWSILVMNEGALRFIRHGRPGGADLAGGTPNRLANAFLGALFEVIFGLFGLFVGLAGGAMDYFNKSLTYALMGVQMVLGWYTFIVYVFIIPAYRIANEKMPMLGMDAASSRAIGVFGILTSLSWCLALQGGQFVFICRMMAYAGDADFLKQRTGAKMRAIFWNVNYALAGLWALITACIVINRTGGAFVTGRFFAPPNVGRLPYILLLTSLLMTLWPIVGIALVVTGKHAAVRRYTLASFFVFLIVYANYTLIQFGMLPVTTMSSGNPAVGAGMHNHLTMMLAFLGPYFMNKAATEAATVDQDAA